MMNIEEKVDMSLDELVSMRQKEAKAKKGEGKKSEGKFSAGKKVENKQQQSNNGRRGPKTAQPKRGAPKDAVMQESGRSKRQAKMSNRRGLESMDMDSAATHRGAQKSALKRQPKKTETVTLRGRGAKQPAARGRGAASSNNNSNNNNNNGGGGASQQKLPKTFSIEPTGSSRPVSIKDFELPPNTKMTIAFTSTRTGAQQDQRQPAKRQPAKQQVAAKARTAFVQKTTQRRANSNQTAKNQRATKVNDKRGGNGAGQGKKRGGGGGGGGRK